MHSLTSRLYINLARWTICTLGAVLAACVPLQRRADIPARWIESPNFDDRRPQFVVIHHTSDDTVEQALGTLTSRARAVSAHYLIARDGTVIQLVREQDRAWHAGASKWGSVTDMNSASLGIELDNNGHEPFAEVQISALIKLLTDIQERFHIPGANVVGHADVAPRRKVDPSVYFPWKTLAAHGFGRWCASPTTAVPSSFNGTLALQALGYDVSDTEAAIIAFKRHFLADESSPTIGPKEREVLHCLIEQLFE